MSQQEWKIGLLEHNSELLRRVTYMIGFFGMVEFTIYLGKLAEPITPQTELIYQSKVKRMFSKMRHSVAQNQQLRAYQQMT